MLVDHVFRIPVGDHMNKSDPEVDGAPSTGPRGTLLAHTGPYPGYGAMKGTQVIPADLDLTAPLWETNDPSGDET